MIPLPPDLVSRARGQIRAHPVLLAGLALSLLYLWTYFQAQALPGNSVQYPLGWWGWFDQGKTLDSARALAARDLSPARHWYPLGYSLLGAPFYRLGFTGHPFVFVNLACLLVALAGFVAFASRCGTGAVAASLLFLGAVCGDRQIFSEWAIPWNSTPAAALIWLTLPVCAMWLQGRRYPALLGALAGLMPLFRPTEAVPVAASILFVLVADWRAGGLRPVHLLRLATGGLAALLPMAALHLAIYGFAPSEYMLISRRLGFSLHDFGWKAYVILADPYPWFADGPGLLRRVPWVALALAGFVPALVRGGAAGVLAAALGAHLILYLTYMDLLPTGIWRFNNVHYWKWAMPGYALLAYLLLRDLVRWRWAAPSYAALAGVLLAAGLSAVRVAARPAGPDMPAKMLEFHGTSPGFEQAYFSPLVVHDAQGRLENVNDIRAIPIEGGVRLIALRRPFQGAITAEPGHGLPAGLLDTQPVRYAAGLALGRPCWVPFLWCGPRPRNAQLPPAG